MIAKHEDSNTRILNLLRATLGPQVCEYLDENNAISDIMCNPDETLWIDQQGVGCINTGIKIPADKSEQIIRLISGKLNIPCNSDIPRISAELPGSGNRFQGYLPPATEKASWIIRKKALLRYTLDDYVEQKVMTPLQKNEIIQAVASEQNILIAGATKSGKTTFGNAVLQEIVSTGARLGIIELVKELQCNGNVLQLRASKTNKNASMSALLEDLLKSRPDRIIIGEVTGPEALLMLEAWNTGHSGGMATIHANSALDGLYRIEDLMQRANVLPNPRMIARAINIVVFMERTPEGRKISEIIRVTGYKYHSAIPGDGEYTYEKIA